MVNNNSILFQLAHLEKLNLSSNHFNYSQIPSQVGDLLRLTHLDLSASNLYGPHHFSYKHLLEMKAPGLRSLAQNLTSLEELLLGSVKMPSLPNTLANLSSLRRMSPKLRYLGVGNNCVLTGRLPDLNSSNPLEELQLPLTSFSGELPASIGILPSLSYLDVSNCKFSGSILASLADLSNLKYLNVSINPFTAQSISFFSWVGKKKKLTTLAPEKINLYGKIPPSIGNSSQPMELNFADNQLSCAIPSQLMNLTQLTFLVLASNRLSGSVPSWFMNMTRLVMLELAVKKFHGEIPSSISQLQNLKGPKSSHAFLKLQILDLSSNAFIGKLPMEFFQSWNAMKFETRNFTYMHRDLYLPIYLVVIYKGLKWYYPKISEVFTIIDLSRNLLKGEIPSAIGDVKGLQGLNLANNSLTSHSPSSLENLTTLEQIPQKLTELGFLSFLNVSHNNLTKSMPRGKRFDTFLNDLGSPIEPDWKIVLLGHGSGLVIGVAIENAFISRKHDWFEGNAKRKR
ncbi:hypothetical protein EUGRSUZ_K00639 [Eucalyptus grandis]|uniref:Uncharacterized protein n=2 Tax=Eucalyptus grandis TaxID=71139 RepID=A0ACC3IR33_EUCGR|nr:hypothetical protein EUGRSUZ_K00639 [Eucalyptus grandis]